MELDDDQFIQFLRGFEDTKTVHLGEWYLLNKKGLKRAFILEYARSGNLEIVEGRKYRKLFAPGFTIRDNYTDEDILKFRKSLHKEIEKFDDINDL